MSVLCVREYAQRHRCGDRPIPELIPTGSSRVSHPASWHSQEKPAYPVQAGGKGTGGFPGVLENP